MVAVSQLFVEGKAGLVVPRGNLIDGKGIPSGCDFPLAGFGSPAFCERDLMLK